MTELFDALAVMDSPVSDEDKVVHLLASLPDSFGDGARSELRICAKDGECN